MARFETWFSVNLNKAPQVQTIHGNVFSQDHLGNLVGVRVMDGNAEAVLSGSVIGYIIRDDGKTVMVTGTVSGNSAYIILPESAYAVPGRIQIALRLISGSTKTVLLAAIGTVTRTATGTIIDPGDVVPDIEDVIAKLDEMDAAIEDTEAATLAANTAASGANSAASGANTAAQNANTAANNAATRVANMLSCLGLEYSSAVSYLPGAYAVYGDKLYKRIGIGSTRNIAPKNATYWEPVTVAGELDELANSVILSLFKNVTEVTDYDDAKTYKNGDYTVQDDEIMRYNTSGGIPVWESADFDIGDIIYYQSALYFCRDIANPENTDEETLNPVVVMMDELYFPPYIFTPATIDEMVKSVAKEEVAPAIASANAAAQNANNATGYITSTEATSTASVAHAKGSYLIYNATLFKVTADIAIGDTLSTTGTGANIVKVTGGAMAEVADLKSAMKSSVVNEQLYGASDALLYGNRNSVTRNGITYTFNSDGSCTVNGTASTTSYVDYFSSPNSFPDWIIPGVTYDLDYSAQNVYFRVVTYTNGVVDSDNLVNRTTSGSFVVPDGKSGIIIRLAVPKNRIVNNETVNPHLFVGIKNADIEEELNAAIKVRTGAYTGSSINSIAENSVYICDGNQVTDLPNSTHTFVVETIFTAANNSTGQQTAFDFNNGDLYWRKRKDGTWKNWINANDPYGLSIGTKYVAFGDSLTWGAVWDMDQTTPYYRAATKYQIPTRIANATGMIDNYENLGIGGAGYYAAPSGNVSVTDAILAYDFTDVELVTIMSGVNDKADSNHPLGSAENPAEGTICGAVKQIIDFFANNFPRVQIVFIQPTPSGHLSDPWAGRLAAGWSLNDFDEEVGKLCHNEHVGYVNWWESVFCKQWDDFSGGYSKNPTSGNVSGPNYSHPTTEKDYAMIGDFIAGKVATLFRGRN